MIGRWLKALPEGSELPALSVVTTLPGALEGHEAAVAEKLGNLFLAGWDWLAPALRQCLQKGFGAHGPIDASMRQLLDLSQSLSGRIWSDADETVRPYAPSVAYPADNPISAQLTTRAQTLKLGMGTRVAMVDVPGWEMHVRQLGDFGNQVTWLSEGLMAF